VSKEIDDLDFMKVSFPAHFFFFDTDGLFLPKDTVARKSLPTQLPTGGVAEALADQGTSSTVATQAMMGGNLIMNIILSASLNYLWGMVNTL